MTMEDKDGGNEQMLCGKESVADEFLTLEKAYRIVSAMNARHYADLVDVKSAFCDFCRYYEFTPHANGVAQHEQDAKLRHAYTRLKSLCSSDEAGCQSAG